MNVIMVRKPAMTIRSVASFSNSARDKPAVAAAVAGESGLDDQAGRLSYEAEAAALSGGISAAGIEVASSGNGSAEVSLPQRPRRRQEAGHALPREIADDQPRNDMPDDRPASWAYASRLPGRLLAPVLVGARSWNRKVAEIAYRPAFFWRVPAVRGQRTRLSAEWCLPPTAQ